MGVDDDSDYELVSRKDIERLKRDGRRPTGDDKYSSLENSMERLNASINKLISILEDAQEDIIEEYQESKPVEKLNQMMDQNETIAKAIISMHSTLKKGLNIDDEDSNSVAPPSQRSPQRPADSSIPTTPSALPKTQMEQMPAQSPTVFNDKSSEFFQQSFQQSPQFQQSFQQSPQFQPQFQQMKGMTVAQAPPVYSQMPSMPSPQQTSNQPMPPVMQPSSAWNQQPRPYPYGPAPMQQGFPQQNLPDLNSLEAPGALPPLDMPDDLPPLDNSPIVKKKKFLGLI